MTKEDSSIEIEKAILGLVILDSKLVLEVVDLIESNDFYNQKHQIIFEIVQKLANSQIDIEVVAIVEGLRQEKQLDKIGGEKYIAELIDSAGLKNNLSKFLEILLDKSQLRQIKIKLKELLEKLEHNNLNIKELIEKIATDILNLSKKSNPTRFENINVILEDTINKIILRQTTSQIAGIPTAWNDFDELTHGFQKGDLIIIGGRPSSGKTAFALNIVIRAARRYNVAFFSLEMPKDQLITRILSSVARIDNYKFKKKGLTELDWQKLELAKKDIANYKLFIDDTAGLTLSEIMWRARKQHSKHPIDLIIIDYMQLIFDTKKNARESRQLEVTAISRGLKKLARELNIPIIALTQLSRRVEQREDKRPILSDIRESGAIEQDADLIIFLYREDMYKKKTDVDKTNIAIETVKTIISKHRNGATGLVELIFEPKFNLFSSKIIGDN